MHSPSSKNKRGAIGRVISGDVIDFFALSALQFVIHCPARKILASPQIERPS